MIVKLTDPRMVNVSTNGASLSIVETGVDSKRWKVLICHKFPFPYFGCLSTIFVGVKGVSPYVLEPFSFTAINDSRLNGDLNGSPVSIKSHQR